MSKNRVSEDWMDAQDFTEVEGGRRGLGGGGIKRGEWGSKVFEGVNAEALLIKY